MSTWSCLEELQGHWGWGRGAAREESWVTWWCFSQQHQHTCCTCLLGQTGAADTFWTLIFLQLLRTCHEHVKWNNLPHKHVYPDKKNTVITKEVTLLSATTYRLIEILYLAHALGPEDRNYLQSLEKSWQSRFEPIMMGTEAKIHLVGLPRTLYF